MQAQLTPRSTLSPVVNMHVPACACACLACLASLSPKEAKPSAVGLGLFLIWIYFHERYFSDPAAMYWRCIARVVSRQQQQHADSTKSKKYLQGSLGLIGEGNSALQIHELCAQSNADTQYARLKVSEKVRGCFFGTENSDTQLCCKLRHEKSAEATVELCAAAIIHSILDAHTSTAMYFDVLRCTARHALLQDECSG